MSVDLRHLLLARLDFVKPMLAKLTNSLPTQGNWLYELKLDGYRALVMNKRGTITLFSRRGNELNQRFPALEQAFDFLPDNTIIDGEVVALDDQGRPSFSALQNYGPRLKSIYFYAFDLLVYEGKDLRKLPLSDRRIVLEKYALPGMRDPVRVSSIFNVSAKQLIAAAKKSGLEGIIAKRVDSSRSDERLKWLKPRLVAHIEFTEWTERNHLRHSKFIGLRDDKQAVEVTNEIG